MFLNINRNKRSITLDLKSEKGHAVFLDLAARADIVIQNFRPGVVERASALISERAHVIPVAERLDPAAP